MFVIAIAEIAGTIEDEAAALAEILGTSTYDVRLALHGTPPSVAGLDLPVHLLARWLIEPRGGPYRDARGDG